MSICIRLGTSGPPSAIVRIPSNSELDTNQLKSESESDSKSESPNVDAVSSAAHSIDDLAAELQLAGGWK